MPSRGPEPLLRVSCFSVLIGDRELGFADVSRLASESDPAASPEQSVHRLPPVVFRRALTTSTELYDWRRVIVSGKDDRRDVTIHQLSAPGGAIVNSWRLMRAWPCRWSVTGFNALSNEIALEELEVTFDDLVWLEHKPGG